MSNFVLVLCLLYTLIVTFKAAIDGDVAFTVFGCSALLGYCVLKILRELIEEVKKIKRV